MGAVYEIEFPDPASEEAPPVISLILGGAIGSPGA
jgi:hypothetical protein